MSSNFHQFYRIIRPELDYPVLVQKKPDRRFKNPVPVQKNRIVGFKIHFRFLLTPIHLKPTDCKESHEAFVYLIK